MGRDTRPSSEKLSQSVLDGIQACGGKFQDFGVVSTPQLHYFVVCSNTQGAYGVPNLEGYFQKLAKAYLEFRNGTESKDELDFDGANGVGAMAMQGTIGQKPSVTNAP